MAHIGSHIYIWPPVGCDIWGRLRGCGLARGSLADFASGKAVTCCQADPAMTVSAIDGLGHGVSAEQQRDRRQGGKHI